MAVNYFEKYLAEKAEVRMTKCWGCGDRPASMWVREVRYLSKKNPNLRISGSDYGGPVPGFCFACEKRAAENLAKLIYLDQIQIGMTTPDEWEIEFTDSTKMHGSILSIVPDNLKVEAKDSYSPSE